MASLSSQEDPPTKFDKGSMREIETLHFPNANSDIEVTDVRYRLYKRRFAGLVGFVSWP